MSPKVEMNGALLDLAGLRPEWLSKEMHSNCVCKLNLWLQHDVVEESVTFSEQP